MPAGHELEFSGLTKRFGPVEAVSDLTARVRPGVVTGFLGPNGAGKSTTLRMLLGLIRPTSGSATIDGKSYAQLARPVHTVGAVLEATSFHPGRSGRNHLKVYAQAGRVDASRIDVVLEMVGLTAAADRKVAGYSLGMRQRLALATALLGDPGVLVLDEPTNGLDPEGISWMRDMLRALAAEGRTVLVSSHMLAEVQQTADELIIIANGRLVFQGEFDALLAGAESPTVVDSPDRAALTTALTDAGIPYQVLRSGITVRGASTTEVGAAAAAAGVPLSGLQRRGPSLEDVFFDLVSGARVHPSGQQAAVNAAPTPAPTASPVATAPEPIDVDTAAVVPTPGATAQDGVTVAAAAIASPAEPSAGVAAAAAHGAAYAAGAAAAGIAAAAAHGARFADQGTPAAADANAAPVGADAGDSPVTDATAALPTAAAAEDAPTIAFPSPASADDAPSAALDGTDPADAPTIALDAADAADLPAPEAATQLLELHEVEPAPITADVTVLQPVDADAHDPSWLPMPESGTAATVSIPTMPTEDEHADTVADDSAPTGDATSADAAPTGDAPAPDLEHAAPAGAGRSWWEPAEMKFPLSNETPPAAVPADDAKPAAEGSAAVPEGAEPAASDGSPTAEAAPARSWWEPAEMSYPLADTADTADVVEVADETLSTEGERSDAPDDANADSADMVDVVEVADETVYTEAGAPDDAAAGTSLPASEDADHVSDDDHEEPRDAQNDVEGSAAADAQETTAAGRPWWMPAGTTPTADAGSDDADRDADADAPPATDATGAGPADWWKPADDEQPAAEHSPADDAVSPDAPGTDAHAAGGDARPWWMPADEADADGAADVVPSAPLADAAPSADAAPAADARPWWMPAEVPGAVEADADASVGTDADASEPRAHAVDAAADVDADADADADASVEPAPDAALDAGAPDATAEPESSSPESSADGAPVEVATPADDALLGAVEAEATVDASAAPFDASTADTAPIERPTGAAATPWWLAAASEAAADGGATAAETPPSDSDPEDTATAEHAAQRPIWTGPVTHADPTPSQPIFRAPPPPTGPSPVASDQQPQWAPPVQPAGDPWTPPTRSVTGVTDDSADAAAAPAEAYEVATTGEIAIIRTGEIPIIRDASGGAASVEPSFDDLLFGDGSAPFEGSPAHAADDASADDDVESLFRQPGSDANEGGQDR